MIHNDTDYNIVLNDEWEIETDEGWQDFQGTIKTAKSDTVTIKFTEGTELVCSLDHGLFTSNFEYVQASKLNVGDKVLSKSGSFEVSSIEFSESKIELYDIYLSDNERFYANEVLSLNCGKSTSFEIFICHYMLFQEQKSIAILANKAMSATNILRKVKVAYEMLPKWLQSGVKVWNNGMIELENGCVTLAAATSSSAVRSFSINCVPDYTKVCVEIDGDVYYTSIEKAQKLESLNYK